MNASEYELPARSVGQGLLENGASALRSVVEFRVLMLGSSRGRAVMATRAIAEERAWGDTPQTDVSGCAGRPRTGSESDQELGDAPERWLVGRWWWSFAAGFDAGGAKR